MSGAGIIVATVWSTGWQVSEKAIKGPYEPSQIPYRTEVINFSIGVGQYFVSDGDFSFLARREGKLALVVARGVSIFTYDKAAIIFPPCEPYTLPYPS